MATSAVSASFTSASASLCPTVTRFACRAGTSIPAAPFSRSVPRHQRWIPTSLRRRVHGRSLFDLYSNFTFYLSDPVHGDAFQQHDSRLQQGANTQYLHPHKLLGVQANFTAGANYHDNEINVGLYPRLDRAPTGVAARAY